MQGLAHHQRSGRTEGAVLPVLQTRLLTCDVVLPVMLTKELLEEQLRSVSTCSFGVGVAIYRGKMPDMVSTLNLLVLEADALLTHLMVRRRSEKELTRRLQHTLVQVIHSQTPLRLRCLPPLSVIVGGASLRTSSRTAILRIGLCSCAEMMLCDRHHTQAIVTTACRGVNSRC
eukprot:1813100-Rhodomonas_salina.8